jgi:hypothetical protein
MTAATTRTVIPLQAGDWRLYLSDLEAAFAQHLVTVAGEHRGMSSRGQTRKKLLRRLQPGEVVLPRRQWWELHTVLAHVDENPELFGATDSLTAGQRAYVRQIVARLRAKLPLAGAGSYDA